MTILDFEINLSNNRSLMSCVIDSFPKWMKKNSKKHKMFLRSGVPANLRITTEDIEMDECMEDESEQ